KTVGIRRGRRHKCRSPHCMRRSVKKVPPGIACRAILERAMGIEPTTKAWEALVLPLNYARSGRRGDAESTRPGCRSPGLCEQGHTKKKIVCLFHRGTQTTRRA